MDSNFFFLKKVVHLALQSQVISRTFRLLQAVIYKVTHTCLIELGANISQ